MRGCHRLRYAQLVPAYAEPRKKRKKKKTLPSVTGRRIAWLSGPAVQFRSQLGGASGRCPEIAARTRAWKAFFPGKSRLRSEPLGLPRCLTRQTSANPSPLPPCASPRFGRRRRGTEYTPEQLDQLLAPIALYPDPLIALILPASTVPSDISLAAQYLAANGDPSGIDSQPWDPEREGPGALSRRPEVDERQPRLDAGPRARPSRCSRPTS